MLLMFSQLATSRAQALVAIVLTSSLTWCAAAQSPQFLPAQPVGAVQQPSINEASGLAASRAHPGVLWVHNDSGDTARVFAMNVQGTHLGTYALVGASATDWEDIAIGPGPVDGRWYLYLGDTGDNSAVRPTVRVYRVPEPDVSPSQLPVNVDLSGVETFTLQYPDGPRDAETLMVDPTTGDWYVVSKRESLSRLYRVPYPQSTGETIVMEYRGQLPWGGATAGDISPSGGEILVRAYTHASLWRRPAGTPLWDAFQQVGYSVPLATEPQGEAIGYGGDGRGYYTTSEGAHQPVYYYQRVPADGDLDSDGDVDIDDYVILAGCLTGPEVPAADPCALADVTGDGVVDLVDLTVFQAAFTGGPSRGDRSLGLSD